MEGNTVDGNCSVQKVDALSGIREVELPERKGQRFLKGWASKRWRIGEEGGGR
jgi:hypothetical protein